MGRIQINNLRCNVAIGINEAERAQTQPILVTVALHLDLEKPSKTDQLDDTVDYFRLAKSLKKEAEKRPCRLLEHLAGRLADTVLSDERVASVRIRVRKFPRAMERIAESVQVELTRRPT